MGVLKKTIKKAVKKSTTINGVKSIGKVAEARKKSQKIIERGLSSGLEDLMKQQLGTLDVNVLVHNKTGHENLKKQMKRIRNMSKNKNVIVKTRAEERKELIEYAENLADEKRYEAVQRYGARSVDEYEKKNGKNSYFRDYEKYNMNSIKKYIRDMERDDLGKFMNDYQNEIANDFYDKYFKEITLDEGYEEIKEELMTNFEGNLSGFNDLVDYITSPTFLKNYDSDQERELNPDGYHDEIRNRYVRIKDAIETKSYLKK